MTPKRQIRVYLDQEWVDVFKLDALLSHSTVSARVREILEERARELQQLQPHTLFEIREQQGYAQ